MRIESWAANLRLAWRNAVRRPGFTAVIVLTLALGIGVNSAVFALLDGVLLRPLPYRDPSRLVFVWQTLPRHGVFELEATPFDYAAWRSLSSFESVAMIAPDAFTISEAEPERVRGARVTASLLPLLGIAPRLGRTFTAAEDDDSAAPVAILSDGLWRRRYGADPRAIGRSIRVNGAAHTIVGILPAGALLPGPLAATSELWLPARMSPRERTNDQSHNYTVVARLAAGVTAGAASADVQALAARLATERPDTHQNVGARLVGVDEQTVRAIRPALTVIAGGVALLLMAACANAATLLIARAAGQARDRAVREALGATSADLLALAAAESVVYAGLSASVGLGLGGWTLRTLLPVFAGSLPPAVPIDLNGRVVLFTGTVAAAVAVAFGMLVGRSRPRALADALKASGRMVGAGGSPRTRALFVVAQISFAVVLLAAAGLLMDSFVNLARVKPGFDADRVLSFRISLGDSGYAAEGPRIAFVDSLLQRLSATPGVSGAGLTSLIPFGGSRGADSVEIEGRPVKRGEPIIIDQRRVSPSYFATMGVPLVTGRSLLPTDDQLAERVVVINRRMADMYWPGASPLDARVRPAGGSAGVDWFRVVGVVENVRHVSLSRDAVPEMYIAYTQAPVGTFTVVVRAAAPETLVPAVRAALQSIDRRVPVYDVQTMRDRIAASFAQTRATLALLLVTAGLTGMLAAVAIYGSIWYSVTQRVPEIGIRIALGASRRSICASVVASALVTTGIGCAIGIGAAYAARPLIAGLLFRTPASDPRTYGVVLAVLLGITLLAAIGPALRAMRVDPVVALRSE